jgi:hypothetical protein
MLFKIQTTSEEYMLELDQKDSKPEESASTTTMDDAAAKAKQAIKDELSKEEKKSEEKQVQASEDESEKKTDESKDTKTDEKAKELETDDIEWERDGDGNYILRIDPEDPNSTLYKGKTKKEALQHAREGIKAKDSYIRKLKSEAIVPEKKGDSDELAPPDYAKIITGIVQETGFKVEMLSWTDDQWREREMEIGAVRAGDEYQTIKGIRALANERYNKANVDFINDNNLNEESEEVKKILRETDVKMEPAEVTEWYENILDSVNAEPSNFRKNGTRRPGVIVSAVNRELRKLERQILTKQVEKKKDEEVAKSRLEKENVVDVTKTKTKPTVKEKSASTIEEATQRVLEKWKKNKE